MENETKLAAENIKKYLALHGINLTEEQCYFIQAEIFNVMAEQTNKELQELIKSLN
jgi:hypothetical protein